ncbi:MAG TPA: HlyD family efflux transporter periplasmic adaptor subunit, partial [Saprospiraceae bacterium]|nr:HlyD family efflux transporter periplasmic adaptor subunit [Saprospiraceae bacterium]
MANIKNKNLFIVIGSLILLAIVGFYLKSKQKKGIIVYTTKVEKRNIQETVLASGKIYPKTEVKISSDVSGEIVELYVKEGDTIKANQLLARINPDAYASAVERGRASVNSAKAQEANSRAQAEGAKARKIQAEAQLEQINAQLKNTKSIFDRNKSLLKKGVISQADYDAAEAAYLAAVANKKSAQASVASATASYNSALQSVKAAGFNINNAVAALKEMNTSLQRTSIFAPMAGILSKLSVEKGERVVGTIQMAGTEMMRISDFSVMEAQVDVSETNVLQVNPGNKATIEIDAYPDRKFKGTVAEIGNSANNLSSISVNSDQVTNFTIKIIV